MALIAVVLVLAVGGSPQFEHDPPATMDIRCGAHCSYVAARRAGINVGLFQSYFETLGQPEPLGYSLLTLQESVQRHGGHAVSARLAVSQLPELGPGVVTVPLLKTGQYVVLAELGDDRVRLIDPPDDYEVSRLMFENMWGGEALLVSSQPIRLPGEPYPWWKLLVGGAVAAVLVLLGWHPAKRIFGGGQ